VVAGYGNNADQHLRRKPFIMAEIISASSGNKKRTVYRTNKKSTRVDLTPMVDLGFLLITFFIFTTTMNQAKAMDILSPANDLPIRVKESASMTILCDNSQSLYYYEGILKAGTKFNIVNYRELRSVILRKKQTTDPAFLMFIIKPRPDALIGNMIDILDEMQICDIKAGHYAEGDITNEEIILMKKN